jgi:diaminopimelate epimerase
MKEASSEVISFVKASACGNDFLIVEGVKTTALGALSKRMCDRRTGIGADGVEWLFSDPAADIHARLFNADGSEAEISGNGTRCVAAYLCAQANKKEIIVRTGAGLKTCRLISRAGNQFSFETGMGEPTVGEQWAAAISAGRFTGVQVSMGNPHFVLIVEEIPSSWQAIAAEIARDTRFKNGVNIEFVIIRDRSNVDVRLFERGVGETQSSGTGSCAAAVAAIAAGKTGSPVQVHAAGGTQSVHWNNEVILQGSASLLFRGEFFL